MLKMEQICASKSLRLAGNHPLNFTKNRAAKFLLVFQCALLSKFVEERSRVERRVRLSSLIPVTVKNNLGERKKKLFTDLLLSKSSIKIQTKWQKPLA